MFNKKLTIRKVFIGIIIIALVWVMWFIATHGFLIVESLDEGEIVSYSRTYNNLQTDLHSSPSSHTLISAGEYMVQLQKEDGGVYMKKITVPGFLSSVSLTPREQNVDVRVAGRQILPNLAKKDSQLISYSTDGITLPVDTLNIGGSTAGEKKDPLLSEITQQVQITDSLIAGVIQVESGYQPVIYNFSSGKLLYYPFIEAKQGTVSTQRSGFTFTTFNTDSNTLTLYDNTSPGKSKKINLGSIDKVATYNGVALVSYASNRATVLTGQDSLARGDGEQGTTNLSVHVIDTVAGRELSSFTTGAASAVSLSVQAAYIFLQSSSSGVIIDTSSGHQEMGLPFIINQFRWVSDSQFIYTAGERGIFKGDISDGSSETLLPYSIARPTDICFMSSGMIYFTAYTQRTDGVENPDLYRAVLSRDSTEQTKKNLASFPYQGKGFYIDYIDNKLSVQLTKYIDGKNEITDTEAKENAIKYISNIFGGSVPKINYQYVHINLSLPPS